METILNNKTASTYHFNIVWLLLKPTQVSDWSTLRNTLYIRENVAWCPTSLFLNMTCQALQQRNREYHTLKEIKMNLALHYALNYALDNVKALWKATNGRKVDFRHAPSTVRIGICLLYRGKMWICGCSHCHEKANNKMWDLCFSPSNVRLCVAVFGIVNDSLPYRHNRRW